MHTEPLFSVQTSAPAGPFVLGVDLDGVCADYTTAFRSIVAEERGIDESELGEQTSWKFDECGWGISNREEYTELHQAAVMKHRMFSTMPEIAGASDTLWKLSDAGVYIRIITHRLVMNWGHDIAVTDTVSWLQTPRSDGRPRIPYRDVCFCAKKADVGADLYIDDAPHNIAALRQSRNEAICFDASYNRELPGLRAADWDEVYEVVMQKLAERDYLHQVTPM
jgi:5'-nucleotidase